MWLAFPKFGTKASVITGIIITLAATRWSEGFAINFPIMSHHDCEQDTYYYYYY